jgi:hypothetical protein
MAQLTGNGGFLSTAGKDNRSGLSVASGYSPFTAADEKIALSMVSVNRKPQYLVFPW